MFPVILLSCGTENGNLSRQRYFSVLYGAALAHSKLGCAAYGGGPPAALAERFDGLLLTGGGDPDAALFRQPPDPRAALPDPIRDAEELALIAAFYAAGKPVLGICRGMQLLTIFFGGTLHQHLDRHTALTLHPVTTAPHSLLRRLCGASLLVNSYHHQAVDSAGTVLRVSARAADGTIEAIEHPAAPVLGVQWHPERMLCGICTDSPCDQSPLFDWLHEAVCAGFPSCHHQKTRNINMKTYRIINLEEGHPPLADALARLQREVRAARRHKIRVLKLIHGYGSSGAGGKLRLAARRELEKLIRAGYIGCYIEGEKLSIFDENTRRAIASCPEFRGDPDIDRHNNGITVVLFEKSK